MAGSVASTGSNFSKSTPLASASVGAGVSAFAVAWSCAAAGAGAAARVSPALRAIANVDTIVAMTVTRVRRPTATIIHSRHARSRSRRGVLMERAADIAWSFLACVLRR
jgi:hypothetical protein